MNEEKALEESTNEIKKEAEKIAMSVTRILMLGGPMHVQNILTSFLKANEDIKKHLSESLKVEFKEGSGI